MNFNPLCPMYILVRRLLRMVKVARYILHIILRKFYIQMLCYLFFWKVSLFSLKKAKLFCLENKQHILRKIVSVFIWAFLTFSAFAKFSRGYVYSSGYVYCFCQFIPRVRLFQWVRLFQTLEYVKAFFYQFRKYISNKKCFFIQLYFILI